MIEYFDVVCDQPGDEPELDEEALAYVDAILAGWDEPEGLPQMDLDQWKQELQNDLSYYLHQPVTDENIANLGGLIDYYFSDLMFQHNDHEVVIERDGPNGLRISVLMNYECSDDFYDDFGISEDQVDVLDLMKMDGLDPMLVGDADLLEDAYWAIAAQHIKNDHDEEFIKAFEETKAAMTETVEASDEVKVEDKILSQSPEDILFEPIVLEEKKPAEPVRDDYDDFDGGCCC